MSLIESVVATGFEPVAEAFAAHGAADSTHSSTLAVYVKGELVLDLTVGEGLQPDSLLPVFSSSKGTGAVAVGLMVQRGKLDLDERVVTYWPEFAANGKGDVLVRELLSHQVGLPGVDGSFTVEELLAHDALAARLAAQRPMWRPGSAFMYHALTIGTLADELVRRVDGRSVAQVLREDVTGPRGIDVWLGTPESEDHRVVPFEMPSADDLMQLLAQQMDPNQLDAIPTASMPQAGIVTLLAQINEPFFRRGEAPAACGFSNARGLARLYASLTNDLDGVPRVWTDDTVAQMSQMQVGGLELGSGLEARFAVIFQKPTPPRWGFGSWQAFGHDGAGGSLAFNDPMYGVAFGYTVQRLPLPGGVDARALELTHILRSCLR